MNAANRDLLIRAATALGPLIPDAMFVGGAIVGLLISDYEATPTRPTDDVDVAVEVATTIDYQLRVGDRLRSLGFEVDTRPHAPICRWRHEDSTVDIMPLDGEILGFKNEWYRAAFAARESYELTPGLAILVISAPFFIATKLEAFSDRGHGDYLGSADLEDIIAVVDGRGSIVDEARALPPEPRRYLATEFNRLLADRDFVDALPGHLGYQQAAQNRLTRLTDRLRALSEIDVP